MVCCDFHRELNQQAKPCVSMCHSKETLIKPHQLLFFQFSTMTSSASILLHALDDLIDEELKKFVFFLTQDLTQEGFPSIPRGKVNQKLREVVVNEMIEVHGEHNAPLVAIIILKKMQKNNSASKLKEQIQKDTNKRTKPDLNAVPLKKQKLADAPNQTCQPAEVENTSGKGKDAFCTSGQLQHLAE